MGSVPEGMRSCGVVQSPASEASRAILRTSEDLPEPASPRTVRPRSWMPATRRGRRTSRQSPSWLVRPAHTLGTVSEPGLNGESSGVLMLIRLSMIGRLDKLIKPTGRRFAPCGGGRPPSSAGALLRDGPAVLDQSPVALRPRGRDGCAGRRAGQDQTAAARGVSAVDINGWRAHRARSASGGTSTPTVLAEREAVSSLLADGGAEGVGRTLDMARSFSVQE